ncbi:MAG TPA: type II secretion system F family protein [Acidimicrobiales bacterium]
MRLQVLAVVTAWAGATLLLGQMRWFRRPRLAVRIRLYVPGAAGTRAPIGMFSVTSFRDIIGPLAAALGTRLSRLFGVRDELAARLARAHSPLSVTAFRSRQLGASVAALGVAAVVALLLRPPPVLGLLTLMGLPLLSFLLLEQQAIVEARSRQRRLLLELPVVTEQLGMLIGAGYSLGGALNRLADRGSGACATDLTHVCARIRQGLSETDALREWAQRAEVDALTRLVTVLALHREGGDLDRLVSEEARTVRSEVHRELIEAIERRGQQVWIPVTVATLVPGVLFMVVPFIEAMRLFTSG